MRSSWSVPAAIAMGVALSTLNATALARPRAAAVLAAPNSAGRTLYVPGVGRVHWPHAGSYVAFNRTSAPAVALIAVSDYRDGIIFFYTQYTHVPQGALQLTAYKLRSDAAGNLYVFAGDHVDVYAAQTYNLVLTLEDTGHSIRDLAVYSDGTVYLLDELPRILVYRKGEVRASRSIVDPRVQVTNAIAIAANHDIYLSYGYVAGSVSVGVLPGGKSPLTDLQLAGSAYIAQIEVAKGYIGALAFPPSSLGVVEVFPPHQRQPSHTFSLQALGAPFAFDIAGDLKSFFVADGPGATYQYAYPSGAALGDVLCGENGFCGGVTTLPHPPR